jgi:hypothetical protein
LISLDLARLAGPVIGLTEIRHKQVTETMKGGRAETQIAKEGRMKGHKGAEHHRSAAKHHENAAHHHIEAAKQHDSGDHEKAAHHAHTAHGHAVHAAHHGAEASKHHAEEHGD